MTPKGFEPSTPGLKVQCSDQAELRSHCLCLFGRVIKMVNLHGTVTKLSYGAIQLKKKYFVYKVFLMRILQESIKFCLKIISRHSPNKLFYFFTIFK